MSSLATERTLPQPLLRPPRVTVVVPCFNYARFLDDAVASCLRQEGVGVDVIVVDDASTDASLAVAEAISARDGRVSVLSNAVNQGPVATFNRGLEAATGEFLVRLDADDLLTPGSLARGSALLQHHPKVGLVYGHPVHFLSGSPLPQVRLHPSSWLLWRGRDWLAARCADASNVITSPEAMVRRSVLDQVGGQNPLAHTHDMELWLRVAAHADVGYVGGADQAWHREHDASLSRAADSALVALAELRDAFETLQSALDAGDGVPDAWMQKARRTLRRTALQQALWYSHGSADLAEGLLSFARGCGAEQWEIAVVRRGMRAGAAGRAALRVSSVPVRAVNRADRELRRRRWRRTGVYERLRVVEAPGG